MSHIFIKPYETSLCGKTDKVTHTFLYGDECGECYELAQKLLRGSISIKDIMENRLKHVYK